MCWFSRMRRFSRLALALALGSCDLKFFLNSETKSE